MTKESEFMGRKRFDYVATIMSVHDEQPEEYPISVFWSPNKGWGDSVGEVANAAAAQRTVETKVKYRPITAVLV